MGLLCCIDTMLATSHECGHGSGRPRHARPKSAGQFGGPSHPGPCETSTRSQDRDRDLDIHQRAYHTFAYHARGKPLVHDVPLRDILSFEAWPDCSEEGTCHPVSSTVFTDSHMHVSKLHRSAGPHLLQTDFSSFPIHASPSLGQLSTNHDPHTSRSWPVELASAGLGSPMPGRNADDLLENPTHASHGLEGL
jgi:hypothetical protein